MKFSDEKVAELVAMGATTKKNFKNTAEVVLKDNGKTASAYAIFTATKTSPAPGFAKKAVASFAGIDMNEDGVQFSRVENGYITAGDSLIWDLVVYNGDGTSKNVADFPLANMSVTDILPSVYSYASTPVLSAKIYQLDKEQEDSTTDSPKYGYFDSKDKDGVADNIDELFNYGTVKQENVAVTYNNDGTFTLPDITLKANQCLVIRVLTTIKDGQETEGVITNKGYLTTDKEYSQNAVVAGEPKGKEIWNYANYNIVGLTTESWKTINYKNEGHTGDPHTDPKTDTGYSREAIHNYVQGMQGEKVTYELHIKNTSPQNLESWTIIDRLPYVGDVGLVSGFERDSAFGVMMGEISKITVGGEELAKSDYEVSYSTDKTTVLTEYSKDWFKGTSGEMQWSSKQTDSTIDFRVAFVKNENTIVEPGEEIVITFTGYVPAYVANTGEDNIAWNSFAYAYQCPSIFGDDYVMVAEPAKVGVWVEQPDNTITITINKTSDTAGTFYFALFDTADATGNRLSDVISITIPAGATTGSTSMKVALAELNAKIEALKTDHNTSDEQANNFYVVETDQYGKALKGYTTTYENQEISTDTTENVTVTIKNTANVGKITVNKTVTGNDFEKDTFYFALYELVDGRYVRYEDVPVGTITINSTDDKGTWTFENVPADGTKFYVLECNAKGVLADSAEKTQETYTSASGATYAVTNSGAVTLTDTVKTATVNITNNKQVDYSITVMKSLVLKELENANLTGTFKVGLFNNANGTGEPIETKTVANGQEVVFKNLEAETTYYVFEMIGNTVINDNIDHKFTLTNTKVKDPITNKNETKNVDIWTSYDGNGVTLDEANNKTSATIVVTNTDRNLNQIEVTKIAINEALESDNKYESGHKITVGLYTLKSDVLKDEDGNTVIQYKDASKAENYEPVLNDDKKPITEEMVTDEKGKYSIIFNNLAKGIPYYVFELDAKGNIVFDGNTVEVDKKVYVATYDKSSVVLDGNAPASLTITDTHSNEVELQFSKQDVNGDLFKGATLFISGKDFTDVSYSPAELIDDSITWTTDGENDLSIKNLKPGNYILGEKEEGSEGFANVHVEFTVDENGYIASIGDNSTLASMSATSLTVVNRSEITVSKKAITGDEEVAGAEIKITRIESANGITALNKDYITATYKETKDEETTLTFRANNSFSFISKNAETVIAGLPDGTYTFEEVTSPIGYEKADGIWKFTITKGKVERVTDYAEDEIQIDNNHIQLGEINKITLRDDVVTGDVTISKYDTVGKIEISDATLTITGDTLKDMSEDAKNAITAKEIGEDGKEVTLIWNENGFSYVTTGKKVTISGLQTGVYVLTETVVPENYEEAEQITFEILADGTVKSGALDEEENVIVMVDEPKDIVTLTVSKRDATGNSELEKAILIITRTNEDDVTLEDVTATRGNDDFTGFSLINNNTAIRFESGKTATIFYHLPVGTYTLTEDTAPLGYTTDTAVTFTVNEDVTITSNDKRFGNDKVTLTDKVIELQIDKVAIIDDEVQELAGAELTITRTNEDDVTLNGVTVARGDKEIDVNRTDNTITFISGEEATILSKLPTGNYTLEEVTTPDNTVYQLSETISFTIGTDGKLKNVENHYDSDTDIENTDGKVVSNIKMLDTKAGEVVVSKLDSTTQKGVKGALFTIAFDNENGISADEVTVSQRKFAESFTEENKYTVYTIKDGILSFYSNGVIPATISGLNDGTYTLTEEYAPEGYLINESIVTFEIKDGKASDTTIVIKDEAINVTISKWDIANSKELENATLTIEGDNLQKAINTIYALDENGKSVELVIAEDLTSVSYQTTGKKVTIYGLPAGDYTLTEESAPEGYQIAEEIKFTIDEKGKVKSDALDADGVIVMNDDVITDKVQVAISKKDAASGNELAGAKLTVTNNEGTSLENVEVIGGGATSAEKKGASITFISGNRETTLRDLPAGTYTLTEDTAPLGYTIATKATFTVNEDGTVSTKRVILTDKVIELTIDKVEIAGDGTQELAGAKLTITNTDGTSLEKVTVSGGAKDVEQKDASITFISGEEATILNKFPAGNYTLEEIATPDNTVYQIAETIKFNIDKNGKLQKVQDAYSDETDIKNEDGKVLSNITMLDTKDEVMISKIDSKTHKGVKGALLAITKLDDENGVSDEITVWGKVTRTQVDSLADITEENKYTV
ncbi:MAG: hypothetical protein K2K06_11325, partial [Oscillospiraceae bacterium]|nr:hypothetical protein [Oscillospiraceae bacterium]